MKYTLTPILKGIQSAGNQGTLEAVVQPTRAPEEGDVICEGETAPDAVSHAEA